MRNNTIDYIEFGTTDIFEVKEFYSRVFGWEFKDFGETYTAFSNSGLRGGFELQESIKSGGVLVVLYHQNLDEVKNKIIEFGGKITVDTFSFPGGERFEFSDPVGNVLAVWTEK